MYFTEGHTVLHREAIGPRGPIASRGWSVPEFLRKPIATSDFQVGSGPPVLLSGSTHECFEQEFHTKVAASYNNGLTQIKLKCLLKIKE